jgi:hypothetical protein
MSYQQRTVQGSGNMSSYSTTVSSVAGRVMLEEFWSIVKSTKDEYYIEYLGNPTRLDDFEEGDDCNALIFVVLTPC